MATKEKTAEKAVIELSDFFTQKNEEEGRWVEPKIFGKKMGIELKVLGSNSDALSIVIDNYRKRLSEIEEIADKERKEKEKTELYIDTAVERVTDLRSVEDKDVVFHGKVVTFSKDLIREICTQCRELAGFIVSYSTDSKNFTNKKFD